MAKEPEMFERLEDESETYERIEDESETYERVEPEEVARALGAKVSSVRLGKHGSPFALGAIRSRLFRELVSTGGRRGRKETFSHKKIPLTAREWRMLDEITALVKSRGVNATPGQVGGVLLNQSMAEVLSRLGRVTASDGAEAISPGKLTDRELEEALERIFAAANSAEVYLGQLRPVATELLRRMREAKRTKVRNPRQR